MDYETKDIDFERVGMLLSVVKDSVGVGPQLTAIAAAAMHELVDMNRDLAGRQADAGKAKLRAEQENATALSQANFEEKQHEVEQATTSVYNSNKEENIDVRRV